MHLLLCHQIHIQTVGLFIEVTICSVICLIPGSLSHSMVRLPRVFVIQNMSHKLASLLVRLMIMQKGRKRSRDLDYQI